MVDATIARRWRARALYLALAFVIVFARLLPLDPGLGRLPGPDLVLLLAFAWVLRRPDTVPVVMVAAVMLLTDVLFLRPLGLWAALCVLGLEFLRGREAQGGDRSFLVEWAMVSLVLLAMSVANMGVLTLFAAARPALGLVLIEMLATVAAYPLIVVFSTRILGLRKPVPGAVTEAGRKL